MKGPGSISGRRSGEPRTFGLIYGEADGNYIIVGSKGGAPQHPAWYFNILADPDVQVQIKGRKFHAKARVAVGAERETLWAMMSGLYSGYADVQHKTDREFPVVVLEPLDS